MKIATVDARRWHWALTDATHQAQTGEARVVRGVPEVT